MPTLRGLLHRLYVWIRGERYAEEQREEVEFHLALERMHLQHGGAGPSDAAHSARRRFGNVSFYREASRRAAGLAPLDRLTQDMRYAWRGVCRDPGVAITVVVTFALGVGANAAVFSFLDRVLFRPPAGLADPARTHRLYVPLPGRGGRTFVTDRFSYEEYRAMRDAAWGYARVGATLRSDSSSLRFAQGEVPVRRAFVTADFLPLLVDRPARGRFFTPDEDDIDSPAPVAVVSHALWQRAFGGAPDIVDRGVDVGGIRLTIVGVAPEGFTGPGLSADDIWIPASAAPHYGPQREPWYASGAVYIGIVARVEDGIDPRQARQRLDQAYRVTYDRQSPADTLRAIMMESIIENRRPGARPQEISISVRLAGVALIVLLIACANVANLLLARAARRRREIAVRLALGVSRGRLLQQVLTESVGLALAGAGAALVIAAVAGSVLRTRLMPRVQWGDAVLEARVIWFALALALACGLLAGLAPALTAARGQILEALKGGVRDGASHGTTLRRALLVAQAALSVVLLVGAGLFLRSLRNVQAIDVGFDADRVVVGSVFFPDQQPHPELADALVDLADHLRSAPGVERVALSRAAPLTMTYSMPIAVPRRDSAFLAQLDVPDLIVASPEYFAVTGMRIIAGRPFGAGDREGAPAVAIVSETMARTLWPGESALGKCVIYHKPTNPCNTIVGVAADARQWSLIKPPAMQYFLPLAQRTGPNVSGQPRVILARTAPGQATAVALLMHRELRRLLPNAIPEVASLYRRLEPQLRPWRLGASLFTVFALLALLVAAVGVYGVMSYVFSQRVHELGVRMALGARAADVVRMVLSSSLHVIAAGIALGLLGAIAAGRLVQSLLYGVSARDPMTMIVAPAVLLVIGVAAALPAAWRATRVDPVAVLREP
ncbi:MAG TPA: ADOP family duplicated permease [Gemmatimonadaceae bacterium]|nr:ADOP family duplicated permease [Gemmatimonadaceae bacterium]